MAQMRELWDASRGFTTVWVAHLGRRYGLLAALGRGNRGHPRARVARASGVHPLAVGLWCDAAVALGLITEKAGRLSLAPGLWALLVDQGSPSFMGGHLSYLALRSLDFDGFDDLFRDGHPSARRQSHLLEAFAEATQFDHTAFMTRLLPRVPSLRRLLEKGCEVLDVGSGTGGWEFRVAPRFPKASFTGVEPHRAALALAREQAVRLRLADRVHFVHGSAETMRFDERFDVVYLGEMLCAGSSARTVLGHARKALRPGGWAVVCEGLVEEGRAPPSGGNRLVLPMQLEFALQPARFLGKAELARLLKRAGLRQARFVGVGGGLWFAVARR